MKIWFQRIFSFFLIAIFLFPQVEKAVHDFHHRNDFHCTSSDAHFHETEHHCHLCDYNVSLLTPIQWPDFSINYDHTFYQPLYPIKIGVYVSFPSYFFSLRGPPTVS